MNHRLALGLVSVVFASLSIAAQAAASNRPPEPITANDNTRSAGVMRGDELTLALRAGKGIWRPEGPQGASIETEAFGEVFAPLMVPAPMIRVREGTPVAVSIRNDLGSPLRVHGLCSREPSPCAPIDVPPAHSREVRFTIRGAGTYHYWATTLGAPVPFRELGGALIVDPSEGPILPDRVLVVTEWTSLTPAQLRQIVAADDASEAFAGLRPRFVFTINGLSWPATERFSYRVGDHIRWRVINLSSQSHPMHLHGFYFDVDRLGDGVADAEVDGTRPGRVVTQLLPPGGTMSMTWVPEREGNWLFHCHVMHHISPSRRFAEPEADASHPAHDAGQDHASNGGMAGMVIGVTVLGRDEPRDPRDEGSATPPRQLTLELQPAPMGPPLVVRRDQPVEISVVNRLGEATTIHWHGIELESFYDGVHGWSGRDRRLAPVIEPGGTFVARFTPPRAGTFIYHTHLHDVRQLTAGVYGPVIVTEPGDVFDPATDHPLVLGRGGLASEWESIANRADSTVLNGERVPRFVWKAGARHRLRLINITPDDIFSVCLQSADGPLTWMPLAKDGAALDASAAAPARACQKIAVGETYDFAYEAPAGARTLWLEVRSTGGQWQAQGRVIVK